MHDASWAPEIYPRIGSSSKPYRPGVKISASEEEPSMSGRSIVLILAAIGAVVALGYYFRHGSAAPLSEPSPAPALAPEQLKRAGPLDDVRETLSPRERAEEHANAPPPAAHTYVVSIGDEQVPVQLRPLKHSRGSKIDDGQSGGFFKPLADAARAGDDGAALALYDALKFCKRSPKTRAEFEAGVANRTKWFAETGGVVFPGSPPEDFEQDGKSFEAEFHRCEGVTDDMYTTATELLRASAERGSDDNRILYAEAIASTDPQEARAQYEILWQEGYVAGLVGLSNDSLPHALALKAFAGAEALKAVELTVSPSTFQEASKEAAQILKNPNCCKF